MKKILCALLCALMLLPLGAGAQSPDSVGIAALMARQVSGNSSFRTQLTVELGEEPAFFASAEDWQTLRALLPDLSLESAYVFSRAGDTLGNSQLSLFLKRGQDTLSTLHASGRGESWQLWGDALGQSVLLLPRDTSVLLREPYITLPAWGGALLRDAGLIGALLCDADGWPSLARGLLESAAADAAEQAALDAALQPYISQLSAWMQARTALRLERGEGGGMQTISYMEADLLDCGEEALALLRMFYADDALRGILRRHMTDEEAEAYLEPGMLPLFEAAIGQMQGAGTLSLERRYAEDGALAAAKLSLPFADGARCEWEQTGDAHALSYIKEDTTVRLTARGGADTGWQGDFAWTKGEKTLAGQYQLFVSMGELTIDLSDAGRERKQSGVITLLASPAEGQSYPAQSLTITLAATAGALNSQAAHYNFAFDWQELGGGAYIRAALKTRTGAAIQQAEAAGDARALAELTDGERQALIEQARAHLTNALLRIDETSGL